LRLCTELWQKVLSIAGQPRARQPIYPPLETMANAGDSAADPSSWRNWSPVSPYLAKDPRPDLSQGMSLKMVELIEEKAAEAQKCALEAERLSGLAQKASQEALAAIERKDRETVIRQRETT
jgi:hypothetical protein